jgi:hypothetical protein
LVDKTALAARQFTLVNWDALPRRAEGIEINPVPDGYIVYQPAQDRVHYLNHTAVLVLELCTGRVRAADIPSLLKDAYDLSEPPTDEVRACLETLSTEGLVRQ